MTALIKGTAVVVLSMVLSWSQTACASIILASNSAASTSSLGTYIGSFTYTPSSATSATIVVLLTNTSPSANLGYLTAFAFNNPKNAITNVTLSTATGLTNVLGGASFQNSVAANPFGDFDIGASTSTSFLGVGSPNTGLAAGATGTFTFTLTGTGLNTLSESSFLNTFNANANSNHCNEFFVARFRGFRYGGSDKVPASGGQVPEPTTMAIWSCLFALAIPVRLLQRRLSA